MSVFPLVLSANKSIYQIPLISLFRFLDIGTQTSLYFLSMLPSILLSAFAARNALAFPSLLSEAFINKRNAEPATVDSPCPHMKEMVKRQAPGVTPPFDAATQYVSNQGEYAFVAPGPTDQRGPCQYHLVMAECQYLFEFRSWSECNGQSRVPSS